MMTPAKLDEKQLVREYGEGKSVLFLAKQFGCSASAISRRLRKLGIKARPFSTKGLKGSLLGVKMSEETKEKIRRKALGRVIPPEVRKRMGSKGDKNPGWIDGRTEPNKRARRSAEYRIWREAVFLRDDYACQICGKRGGEINADHIKQFADFPEFRTSISNGRTLCVSCHRQTETYGNKRLKSS